MCVCGVVVVDDDMCMVYVFLLLLHTFKSVRRSAVAITTARNRETLADDLHHLQ